MDRLPGGVSIDVHELRSREEARQLLHVNAAAWRAAYDFLPESALPAVDYHPNPDRVAEFYEQVQHRSAPVFVATRDDQVRGFAELRWGQDETEGFVSPVDAELKALYVHPEDWGRGIGSRLLEAGLFAVPPTYERLSLQTFRANDAAREFYERRGFTWIGEAAFPIDGSEYPTVVYARAVD